jgi:pilus assembly protein CpaE
LFLTRPLSMKIKIITPRVVNAEAWTAALATLVPAPVVEAHAKQLRHVNVLVNGIRPDLVLAETTGPEDLDALEKLASAHPEIDYVLVSADLQPQVLMRMMRAGVREVLPAPTLDSAVAAAVGRLVRKHSAAAAIPPEAKQGRILSVISCKGGSGATFLAANLAHVLAAGGERRVALIDLNLQFGDAALFISSEPPTSHVAEVARNIARLDRDLLMSAMLKAAPGLWVLASPEDPAAAAEVQPEHVQAILRLARECFDFVVIDAGRSLSAVTLQALDASDDVYAVLQLTLPFIRDGKRLRDIFRSLDYPSRKIHWVVNRHEKDSQLTLADVRQTLDVQDLVVLPNQYQAVAASVNQGTPVDRIAPNSPITRALREFAAQLAPDTTKGRGGWLSSLMRGGQSAANKREQT